MKSRVIEPVSDLEAGMMEARMTRARIDGFRAAHDGKDITPNPYEGDLAEHYEGGYGDYSDGVIPHGLYNELIRLGEDVEEGIHIATKARLQFETTSRLSEELTRVLYANKH